MQQGGLLQRATTRLRPGRRSPSAVVGAATAGGIKARVTLPRDVGGWCAMCGAAAVARVHNGAAVGVATAGGIEARVTLPRDVGGWCAMCGAAAVARVHNGEHR